MRLLLDVGLLHTFVKENEYVNGFRHITSDDFCSFKLRIEGGILGTVVIDSHAPGTFNQEIVVTGSHGRLVANGTKLVGYRNIHSKSDSQSNLVNCNLSSSGRFFERSKFESFINEENMKDVKGVQFLHHSRSWNIPGKEQNEKMLSIEEHKALGLKLRASSKSVYDSVPFVNGTYYMLKFIKELFASQLSRDGEEGSDSLKLNMHPLADFSDAIYVQKVIDAIKLSGDTGRWVNVDSSFPDVADEKTGANPFWSQKLGPHSN